MIGYVPVLSKKATVTLSLGIETFHFGLLQLTKMTMMATTFC
jgi:hypothetical protein